MLVDEMPRSFVKKNNSYSHCPLKKRPVHVMLYDEVPEAVKEEIIDVVTDDVPEPENLSTKPEDLSRTAKKFRAASRSSSRSPSPRIKTIETTLVTGATTTPAEAAAAATGENEIVSRSNPLNLYHHLDHQQQQHHDENTVASVALAPPHHQQHQHQQVQTHRQLYPSKPHTPPVGVAAIHAIVKKERVEVIQHEGRTPAAAAAAAAAAPIQPIVKKERVEVIQHDGGASTTTSAAAVAPSAAIHFASTKAAAAAAAAAVLEPLNLNTPVEPVAHYATPAWARAAPLYPPHYLPYPAAYRFPHHHHHHHHHHPGAELYPAYPLPAYPHSSPEHASVSPPPHAALTCPTIQRPIARSYAHWATASSPDHCGLSPTSSLGYGSLRSPPPVTPEDLSSPGSDSGRSSAGSTSAGPTILGMQMDSVVTSNNGNACANDSLQNPHSAASSSSSSSSSATTTSPRYQCPDCGKSYSTYSGLSKHQQFHCAAAEGQTKKSFSCKYCEKVYVSLGALKMHIRTHTLPCKCHLCGKAFSRPWLLQGHIRTHTGEKPFSCQHCNRAFADRSNLRAHLQTHSDVKKYSCTSCSKTFSRMSLLTKHQEGGCPGMAVPMAYGC